MLSEIPVGIDDIADVIVEIRVRHGNRVSCNCEQEYHIIKSKQRLIGTVFVTSPSLANGSPTQEWYPFQGAPQPNLMVTRMHRASALTAAV